MKIIGTLGMVLLAPFRFIAFIGEYCYMQVWFTIALMSYSGWFTYHLMYVYKNRIQLSMDYLEMVPIKMLIILVCFIFLEKLNGFTYQILNAIMSFVTNCYYQCVAWKYGVTINEYKAYMDYVDGKRTLASQVYEKTFSGYSNIAMTREELKKWKEKEEAFLNESHRSCSEDPVYTKDDMNRMQKEMEKQLQKEMEMRMREQQEQMKKEMEKNLEIELMKRSEDPLLNQRTPLQVKVNLSYELLHAEADSTMEEITKHYRELTKLSHPDTKKTEEGKRQAEEYCKRLNVAYQILKDEYGKAK